MAGSSEGGAETFFCDLVIGLHNAGLEQRVAIRSGAAVASRLKKNGLEVIELSFGGLLDFRTRNKLKREIQNWDPNIVQSWMNRATRHCPDGNFIHVGWLGGYYDPKYFHKCNHVIGVTPDIVQFLREQGGWADSRSSYIQTFAPYQEVDSVARDEFDTPQDAPLIVALGRLHTKKAFDILLQAMVQIPKAWLWLAGDGPLRNELLQLSQNLGLEHRVKFLGWREDRHALLSSAQVVVMPSRYEPFGTVMIEAWAAKKPLVVAAAAGPMGLARDGVDALVVPVDNAPQLAGAINKIIDDPHLAHSLAETGYSVWQEYFTEEVVVTKYIEHYQNIGTKD